MKKAIWYLIAVLVSLSLVVSACGSQEPVDVGGDDDPPAGDTLVWAQPSDATWLDVGYAYTAEDLDPVYQMFETLVSYEVTADGIQHYPKLATEWAASDDGTVWTFKLREGVKFHDGTDLNADAVVLSFKRLYDDTHPYYMEQRWSYFGDLMGDFLVDIVAEDGMTVKFILSEPLAPFLTYMGYTHNQGIVSPAAVEKHGEDFFKNPVGTGPFQFEEWRSDDRIVLVSFEDYWGEQPKLDRIIFKVIPEASTRLAELQAGNVHMFMNPPAEYLATLRANPDVAIHSETQAILNYVAINHGKPPLDDVRVREALAIGVDWAKVMEVVWGELGERAATPLPPGSLGYHKGLTPYQYDPERAKTLLEEAGVEEGTVIDMIAPNVPTWFQPDPVTTLEMVQSDLQKIGLVLNPQQMDSGARIAAIDSGDYNLIATGWWDLPEPHNFLYTLTIVYGNNWWKYSNPQLEALANAAASTYNDSEREAMYKEMQEILYEEFALIPVSFGRATLAADARLKDAVIRIDGFTALERAYFQK